MRAAGPQKVRGKGPNGADDNCKFEFDYALRRKGVRKMIAVVMEPGCLNTATWDGPVGGKLGGTLYVCLASDEAFDEGMRRLIKEIRTLWLGTARRARRPSIVPESGSPGGVLRHEHISEHIPELPAPFDVCFPEGSRQHLLHRLSQRLLSPEVEGAASTAQQRLRQVLVRGMGGTGKSTLLIGITQLDEVRAAFDVFVWLAVGETPNVPHLLRSFVQQLGGSAPDDATEEHLRRAIRAEQRRVCLLLDDCWDAAVLKALLCLEEGSAASACIVSSRRRGIFPSGHVAEVDVSELSEAEAVRLLLTIGEMQHLIESPPEVAVQVAKACGRLPLMIGLAGALMRELADGWQETLLPALTDALGESAEAGAGTIEQRLISASLDAVAIEERDGVRHLFCVHACFPEDVVVPASVFDALTPLLATKLADSSSVSKLRLRRWLMMLLDHSLLRGSIATGVFVHDVRCRHARMSPFEHGRTASQAARGCCSRLGNLSRAPCCGRSCVRSL